MYMFWDMLYGNTQGLLMLKWFEHIAAAKYGTAVKNYVFVDNFPFSFSAFLFSFFNMWLTSVLNVLFYLSLFCLFSSLSVQCPFVWILTINSQSLDDPICHIAHMGKWKWEESENK